MGDKQKSNVAIAVLHGIGRQFHRQEQRAGRPVFSKELFNAVRKQCDQEIGVDLEALVTWLEIDYASVFNASQAQYYKRLGQSVERSHARRLVIENFGDAASYGSAGRTEGTAFDAVQASVHGALSKLEQQCAEGAALIVVAHSLGGQVMADYMRSASAKPTSFTRLETLSAFVTLGCNIPLFHLGQHYSAVSPPIPVGSSWSFPWWINIYDRDDLLGFPLSQSGQGYRWLAETGQLKDIEVNAGSLLTRWNTLSHLEYWKNPAVAKIVWDSIRSALPN